MWVALVAGERERASEPVRASEPRGRDARERASEATGRASEAEPGQLAAGDDHDPCGRGACKGVSMHAECRGAVYRLVRTAQVRVGPLSMRVLETPKQVWRRSSAAAARRRCSLGDQEAPPAPCRQIVLRKPSVCPRRCVAHRVRITPNHPLPRPSRRVNPGHPLPQPWRHAARILSTRVLLRAPALQNEPSWLALRCKWAQARARGCTRRTGTPTRTWRRCMPPSRCARKILLLASSLSS